jgi:hypothetical protein
VQVLAQAMVLFLDAAARSRLNTACVVGNVIGGAMGSTLTTLLWSLGGWAAVTTGGIVLSVTGLIVWATGRRGPLRAP